MVLVTGHHGRLTFSPYGGSQPPIGHAVVTAARPRAANSQHAYCAACQPHVPTELLACARCGDGPLLTGALANHISAHPDGHLPTALRHWLSAGKPPPS